MDFGTAMRIKHSKQAGSMDEADRFFGSLGPNQFRAMVGFVYRGRVSGAHLVKDDRHSPFGRLPSRLRACETSPNNRQMAGNVHGLSQAASLAFLNPHLTQAMEPPSFFFHFSTI